VDDISVTADAYNANNQIVFKISFTPPASIVPDGKKIEFSFAW